MGDLVTDRLVLHPMTLGEAVRVMLVEPDDTVRWAAGYPTLTDVAGARRFHDTCTYVGDPRPFGAYEIRRRADGCAIGGVGFHGAADENGCVTIGYGLIPAARGHGYAAEALRELLRFARTQGATGVEGDTAHDNVASQHVMVSAGMRLVAEDDRLKYYKVSWPGEQVSA